MIRFSFRPRYENSTRVIGLLLHAITKMISDLSSSDNRIVCYFQNKNLYAFGKR